jgi:predicted Ser/Thr protein kinase
MPGGRVFGDYELLEEISRGSMGVVWKARQRSLNRIVALKAISAGVLATSEDVARFRSEAETVARIKHPNVISIYEIGEHDGAHFFSMDYIEGRSLETLVQDHPQSPREAASLVRTVAEAVHFMHQHGVMHRDIKPLNIMIDAWGRPMLLDFGLAKALTDDRRLTQSGVVMGSPCYMAPEQAERGEACVGPHTEVHALGITLYQLLTGTVPYSGETAEETLMNVVRCTPKRPSEHVPSIPRDLETIVLKCLEKSPSRRYATARALAEDLERFLAGVPVLAQRAKVGRRVLTWLEQHPWTIAWAGLGMCSLLFGAAFGLWQQTRCLAARLRLPGTDGTPPFGDWLRLTGFEFFTIMSAMLLCAVLIRCSAYGLRVMDAVMRPELMTSQARRPVPPRVLKVSVFIALLGGAQALRSFMGFIERGVWEQTWRWEQLTLETYALAMWSVGVLGMVWRFYRAQHLGMPMPHEVSELPPDCHAAVHAALFRGDQSHAVRLCREATNMNLATATRCVNGLLRQLRQEQRDKFRPQPRLLVSVSVYLGSMIALCGLVPIIALILAPTAWQHATLAALLGILLGITLMDMENWLRKPLHHAALFVTCVVLLARAVIIKMEQNLPDENYLWLAGGILAGAAIVTAVSRRDTAPATEAAVAARS